MEGEVTAVKEGVVMKSHLKMDFCIRNVGGLKALLLNCIELLFDYMYLRLGSCKPTLRLVYMTHVIINHLKYAKWVDWVRKDGEGWKNDASYVCILSPLGNSIENEYSWDPEIEFGIGGELNKDPRDKEWESWIPQIIGILDLIKYAFGVCSRGSYAYHIISVMYMYKLLFGVKINRLLEFQNHNRRCQWSWWVEGAYGMKG